jgi:cbb3-type cytochrome oxidase subunit 3
MLQDFLASRGLGIYPAIALLIFLFCFTVVLAHLLLSRKDHLDRIAHLPLDDDDLHSGGPGLPGRRTGR